MRTPSIFNSSSSPPSPAPENLAAPCTSRQFTARSLHTAAALSSPLLTLCDRVQAHASPSCTPLLGGYSVYLEQPCQHLRPLVTALGGEVWEKTHAVPTTPGHPNTLQRAHDTRERAVPPHRSPPHALLAGSISHGGGCLFFSRPLCLTAVIVSGSPLTEPTTPHRDRWHAPCSSARWRSSAPRGSLVARVGSSRERPRCATSGCCRPPPNTSFRTCRSGRSDTVVHAEKSDSEPYTTAR